MIDISSRYYVPKSTYWHESDDLNATANQPHWGITEQDLLANRSAHFDEAGFEMAEGTPWPVLIQRVLGYLYAASVNSSLDHLPNDFPEFDNFHNLSIPIVPNYYGPNNRREFVLSKLNEINDWEMVRQIAGQQGYLSEDQLKMAFLTGMFLIVGVSFMLVAVAVLLISRLCQKKTESYEGGTEYDLEAGRRVRTQGSADPSLPLGQSVLNMLRHAGVTPPIQCHACERKLGLAANPPKFYRSLHPSPRIWYEMEKMGEQGEGVKRVGNTRTPIPAPRKSRVKITEI